MNIIELIENLLDDRFTRAAASETGLTAEETRTASRAAIPALLAGVLGSISKPAGAKALGSVLKDQNLLGGLSSMLTTPSAQSTGSGTQSTQSITGTGLSALSSLLGEGKISSLTGAIGNFAGISHGQSKSLIGMLFPLVMSVLGREQRGGASGVDGIARLLRSQKREIADALPASVASSLRSTGVLDALDEEPAPRQTAASTTATTGGTPRHTERTHRPVERRRNWLWPVAAGIAAVALVVWGVSRLTDVEPDQRTARDTSEQSTQIAAVPPSDIDLRVGNVDLRQELTGVVDRASQSLRGVTDAASAEAALPTLSELNDDLDSMMPMVARLPEPARDAFADVARNGYSGLEPEIARVTSMPAVPDNVKDVVGELGDKLESFFARGRG